MTNTTNVRNVKTMITATFLMENLINFIRNNKEHFTGNVDKMETNSICVQARSIWTTIAMLENLMPDTSEGDYRIMELWDSCGLGNQLDENEFDLFMWSEVC